MSNKDSRELNIDDYKFQEAWREMESAKLKAVLAFVVDDGKDEELIEYLEQLVAHSNEEIDLENISEIEEVIKEIKEISGN